MNHQVTERPLTKENMKQLKYNLRRGFIVGIILLVIGAIVYALSGIKEFDGTLLKQVSWGFLVLTFILTWLVNRNTLQDLQYGMKLITPGTLSKKTWKQDYEAGSGVGMSFSGKEHAYHLSMRGYKKYFVIINNVRYPVKQDFWESVNEGDEVEIHKTKFSGQILEFSKKKD